LGVIKQPPELLNDAHNLKGFKCGIESLNEWLAKKALKNQGNGASRTFVISDNDRVVGYYALATGSVERVQVPSKLTRNMPDPIPVIVLGRLAVDIDHQGQKLGKSLLKDALLRSLNVSEQIGVSAIIVHAINQEAKRFYLSYGFEESPFDDMTLFMSIKTLIKHLPKA
jgi:predicted GNAT family N-acyltransferase